MEMDLDASISPFFRNTVIHLLCCLGFNDEVIVMPCCLWRALEKSMILNKQLNIKTWGSCGSVDGRK
jgi:hypothetical protein